MVSPKTLGNGRTCAPSEIRSVKNIAIPPKTANINAPKTKRVNLVNKILMKTASNPRF